MRHIARSLIALSVLYPNSLMAGNLSGTYVAKYANQVIMMQLVEGANRTLTGRMTQTDLSPVGAIAQDDREVTGTYDGRTIVVTVAPTGTSSAGLTASGALENGVIRLSGKGSGRSLDVKLLKAEETEYQTAVALLRLRAAAIDSEKKKQAFFGRLATFQARVVRDRAKMDELLGRLSAGTFEQKFQEVTLWMRNAHSRQRAIYGDGQSSVSRAQIDVAINQAAIRAANLHDDVQKAWNDIFTEIQSLIRDYSDVMGACKSVIAATNTTPTSELAAKCKSLAGNAELFKSRSDALSAKFTAIEKVWADERSQQQMIVQAADRLP